MPISMSECLIYVHLFCLFVLMLCITINKRLVSEVLVYAYQYEQMPDLRPFVLFVCVDALYHNQQETCE